MTTPAKLVQLIRNHGHAACIRPNGTLHTAQWITVTCHKEAEKEYRWQEYAYTDISANLPAVLRWLGY